MEGGVSIKLGQKDGQAYREAHASPDPVTRYFESKDSRAKKVTSLHDFLRITSGLDAEFISQIQKLDSATLASLLRNSEITSVVILEHIQKEATARILEKL